MVLPSPKGCQCPHYQIVTVDFKTATDRLTQCHTFGAIAGELGVAANSVLRARMDPMNENSRRAPEGWEKAIAKLARERAAELRALAEELEVDQ